MVCKVKFEKFVVMLSGVLWKVEVDFKRWKGICEC